MKSLNYSPSPAITKASKPCIISGKSIFSENVDIFRKTIYPPTKQITFCSTRPHEDPHSDSDDLTQMKQLTPTLKQASFSGSAPSTGLVFDLGPTGSWDCIEVGSPIVKRFVSDDEERWFMWYHGSSEANPGSDSIGLAVSSNGVHWRRGVESVSSGSGTGLVMKCGGDWWSFDTMGIRPSEVMIMSSSKVRASSSVYWLYYTGYSPEKVKITFPEVENGGNFGIGEVFKSLPGLAMSQDGRNWARIEGDHHSGALFDVGLDGEWDSSFISSPHVVFHNKGDLRMYYHSFDQQSGRFSIGMARSRDGIKWVKLGKVMEGGKSSNGCFDEMGVLNACVVKDKRIGHYVMAYEGVGMDGVRSIGLAISLDGLKDWRRVSEGAILMPSKEEYGWDNKGVGSPCLVQMDREEDKWRLYYTGVGVDGKSGIGLAISEGSVIESFRRWNGFSL